MPEESATAAIKAEVQRFKSHKGYTEELRKEFALAFRNCAPTADIAHALGERLMISCKFYPVPQQVYEAFEAISASMVPEFGGLGHSCDICGGTGWRISNASGSDVAQRCDCPIEKQCEPEQPRTWVASLDEGMTDADMQRWRSIAEHGSTKAAREVATAIVKRYEERCRHAQTAEAKV